MSVARRDLKGLRRITGSQSMGVIPWMNRSAKDEQWLSPHFRGESIMVPAHRTKVFANDTVRKIKV